jgi:zinc transport system substrate-binding protein
MPVVVPPLRRAAALGLVACLVACAAPRREEDAAQGGGGLQVVTTVLPVTLFTRAVAGDCAQVQPLIPANAGAHDFQARPGDVAVLRQARVLVKNGLGLESFLDKLVASADNPSLVVVDSSAGVATLESGEQGHSHGHGDGHAHGAGEVNPHIWLDPLRAVQQVETIRDGLVKADPSCAEGYRRNAGAFIAQLRQLDQQLAAALAPFRGRTLVAFHDVAPYFAERYGLKAEFLVDVPTVNPSPADLQRVVASVRRYQLRALLSEPQQESGALQALAGDLGIGVRVFDPLETASAAEAQQPDTYLKVMARNGEQVRGVFAAR